MADEGAKPWDQLPDEPNAAYARFLIYRNLGPHRSLNAAYATTLPATKRKDSQATGAWTGDSARWNWKERAERYDIHHLKQQGGRTLTKWFGAIERGTEWLYQGFSDPACRPTSPTELREMTDSLGNLIPAETLAQGCADAFGDGPEGSGGKGADLPDESLPAGAGGLHEGSPGFEALEPPGAGGETPPDASQPGDMPGKP